MVSLFGRGFDSLQVHLLYGVQKHKLRKFACVFLSLAKVTIYGATLNELLVNATCNNFQSDRPYCYT